MGFTCNRTKHKEKSSLKRPFLPLFLIREKETLKDNKKSAHSEPLQLKERDRIIYNMIRPLDRFIEN
jgi:hypothetical protein